MRRCHKTFGAVQCGLEPGHRSRRCNFRDPSGFEVVAHNKGVYVSRLRDKVYVAWTFEGQLGEPKSSPAAAFRAFALSS